MNNPDKPSSTQNLALDEVGSGGVSIVRWSIVLSGAIILLGIAVVVYGKIPLTPYPEFVPLHMTFVFVLDAVTAFLLFGQFHYRRLPVYLVLASAYLFNAGISLPFLLAFPSGLQTEGGIIGGSQSAIWLWHYWHILFPAIVSAALILHSSLKGLQVPVARLWPLTLITTASVILLVVLLTYTVTSGHDSLPVLIDVTRKHPLTTAFYWIGSIAVVVTILALGLAWFLSEGGTPLHLWLAVAMTAFLADAVASLGSDARYTFGWYFGRIEAIIAASVLFLVFLGRMVRIYHRLGAANSQLAEANEQLLRMMEQKRQARLLLEKKNQELEQLSKTDSLTQLFNRTTVENHVHELIENSRRYGRPFSVVLLDIDHFKRVNDEFGHNVGDEVLRKVAAILAHRVRTTDLVGRWGGEEFLIVCAEVELGPAAELAEALRTLIETTSFGLPTQITASFGAAQYAPGEQIQSLISRADRQLYVAKERGRNRVAVAH